MNSIGKLENAYKYIDVVYIYHYMVGSGFIYLASSISRASIFFFFFGIFYNHRWRNSIGQGEKLQKQKEEMTTINDARPQVTPRLFYFLYFETPITNLLNCYIYIFFMYIFFFYSFKRNLIVNQNDVI